MIHLKIDIKITLNRWKVVSLFSIMFIYCNINVVISHPDWIKNQKKAINPINKKYNKCFQYAETVALNHEIKKDPQSMAKIKPFINKYNWKEINFPSWLEKIWEK